MRGVCALALDVTANYLALGAASLTKLAGPGIAHAREYTQPPLDPAPIAAPCLASAPRESRSPTPAPPDPAAKTVSTHSTQRHAGTAPSRLRSVRRTMPPRYSPAKPPQFSPGRTPAEPPQQNRMPPANPP